jgi:hypothetical protein
MMTLLVGWLPVTHDSASLEESSVPSGTFNIARPTVLVILTVIGFAIGAVPA